MNAPNHCGFCGKPASEVKKLIPVGQSSGGMCDECIEKADAIVAENKPTDLTLKDFFKDKPLGAATIAEARGFYERCHLVSFVAASAEELAEKVNEYFRTHLGVVVVDIKYSGIVGVGYVAFLWMTQEKSDKYIEQAGEYQGEVERIMAEREAERLEAQAKEEEAREAAMDEETRLREIGKKCEEHHKKVIEENRRLHDELKKLNKKVLELSGKKVKR